MNIKFKEKYNIIKKNIFNKKNLKEIFFYVFFIIFLLFVRNYCFQINIVSGSSMESTLNDKDIIFNKIFNNKEYKRGDIIIFTPEKQNKYYIKRIIGIEGDEILLKDGYVFLKKNNEKNFVKLNELYLNTVNIGNTYSIGIDSFKVKKNKYFVLGDNRLNSSDSRTCFVNSCLIGKNNTPYVKKEQIVGKYIFKIKSFIKNIYNK